MRALVQRVISGRVDIHDPDGGVRTTGSIGKGLVVLFGVSVDELIGMDDIASAAKLDEINQKWNENNSSLVIIKA